MALRAGVTASRKGPTTKILEGHVLLSSRAAISGATIAVSNGRSSDHDDQKNGGGDQELESHFKGIVGSCGKLGRLEGRGGWEYGGKRQGSV